MILLLGFKNFDDHDCEYQVTGDDLLRIAAVIDHPISRKGTWCHVTFYSEDLDNAPISGDKGGREDDRAEPGQYRIFGTTPPV